MMFSFPDYGQEEERKIRRILLLSRVLICIIIMLAISLCALIFIVYPYLLTILNAVDSYKLHIYKMVSYLPLYDNFSGMVHLGEGMIIFWLLLTILLMYLLTRYTTSRLDKIGTIAVIFIALIFIVPYLGMINKLSTLAYMIVSKCVIKKISSGKLLTSVLINTECIYKLASKTHIPTSFK